MKEARVRSAHKFLVTFAHRSLSKLTKAIPKPSLSGGRLITYFFGSLLGILITLGAYLLLGSVSKDTFIAAGTNIVIAAATVIAVILHSSSLQHQKKERVWGIKKEILLKLSHTLSEVMNITSKHVQQAYMEMEELSHAEPVEGGGEQYKDFSKSIRECLFVYRPLLDMDLIAAIELFETTDDRIEQDVNNGALNTFEAYEQLYEAQQTLHKKISSHIKLTADI